MAFKIVRTKRADKNLEQIVDYLQREWNDAVVRAFIAHLVQLLDVLSLYPEIGKVANNEGTIRSFPVTKHTRLFYRIKGNRIILLNFFDNRQRPASR